MNTRRIAHLGVLIALSVIGSVIKIPSFVGSLAFDAVPGYFAAFAIDPLAGALVALLGHVATATVSGFPLGPIHAIIALGMALAAYAAGRVGKISLHLGGLTGIVVNGLLLPAAFIVIPGFGLPFFVAATPEILLASVLNVGTAALLHSLPVIKRVVHGHGK